MKRNNEQKETTQIYDACIHSRLISDFETINRKISFMSELSSEDFLPLNQKLRSYQKCLYDLSGNEKFRKNLGASGIYTSISELIRDMQFHDIIQQRLDHIRRINNEILEELNKVDFEVSYLDKTKYVKIIPLLAKINLVQLHVVNVEYRLVVENLRKVLNNLNEFVEIDCSLIPVYHFNNVELFDVLTEAISSKLKNISKLTCPEHISIKEVLPEEIEYVQKVYTMKAERDIFNRILELSDNKGDVDFVKDIIMKETKQSVSDNRLELF
jgi:hypothetical protein